MRCLVFNGWAAGPEIWARCTFAYDRLFDYIEQLDGVPEKVMETLDETVLVGFSLGGSTALRLLLRFPEKVKGLVLISTTPCMMEQRRSQVEGQRSMVVWKGMSLHRRAALKYGTQLTYRDNPSPLYAEPNLDRGLDYLQNTDLRGALMAFRARTTSHEFSVSLFQSEHDGIVRSSNVDFLKGIFPQAEVMMVPGNEHTLPLQIPSLIDRAVSSVLEKAKYEI